jgi:low affinity Fe/Cu permease
MNGIIYFLKIIIKTARLLVERLKLKGVGIGFLKIIIKTARKLVECLKDVEYWNARFDHFARFGARFTGRPLAFNAAMLVILVWIITGPLFGFSDTWQLIINTATTVVTFLMVFLIQHTQNRDTEALQIKMDELIRVIEGANKSLLDLEELEEQELSDLRKQYVELARLAREKLVNKSATK